VFATIGCKLTVKTISRMENILNSTTLEHLVDSDKGTVEIPVENCLAPVIECPMPLLAMDSQSLDGRKTESVVVESSDLEGRNNESVIIESLVIEKAIDNVETNSEKQLSADKLTFESNQLEKPNVIDEPHQPNDVSDRLDSIEQNQSNHILERIESSQQDVIKVLDNNQIEECDSRNSASVPWPVHLHSTASVDGDDPSLSSSNIYPIQQQPIEIKTWPFPKNLGSAFRPNSGLSRGSSDADFCTVDSVDGSKQGCSLEDSEHCSSSQSPLSYVIQLNEDSECSLPSEAGNSAGCPTGFDRILMNRVNCQNESVNESMELDIPASQHSDGDQADSELIMDVESGIKRSDVTDVTENSTPKAVRNSSQRNRRARKNKEQGGDEQKSEQSASRNRQRKKVSITSEVENIPRLVSVK